MKSVLFLFFFATLTRGLSQCCSPGNPVGGDANQGVMNKNTLRTILFYKNSVSNDYYEGAKKFNGKTYVDKGSYNFSGFTLAYGLLKKLTFECDLGYFINKSQEFNTREGKQILKGTGLSDLGFGGKYKLFFSSEKQLEITGGAGYKISVGEYQQRNEKGILLPVDIQPATGASGPFATLFLYRGFIEKKIRLFSNSRVQITPNPVVLTEIIPTKYYLFGTIFTSSAFASWSISHRWNLILQTRYEFRAKDRFRFEGNEEFKNYESSGGQKVLAVPQVVFEIRPGFMASALFDIPVYQYYNERQLATAYACTFGLSKVFDLGRSQKKPIELPSKEN